jgi:hypothetical protein
LSSYNWFFGSFKSFPKGLEEKCIDLLELCCGESYPFKQISDDLWCGIIYRIMDYKSRIMESDLICFDTEFGKNFLKSDTINGGYFFIEDRSIYENLEKRYNDYNQLFYEFVKQKNGMYSIEEKGKSVLPPDTPSRYTIHTPFGLNWTGSDWVKKNLQSPKVDDNIGKLYGNTLATPILNTKNHIVKLKGV